MLSNKGFSNLKYSIYDQVIATVVIAIVFTGGTCLTNETQVFHFFVICWAILALAFPCKLGFTDNSLD
jgi:hypothetical protein